jgi:hypothetical protein
MRCCLHARRYPVRACHARIVSRTYGSANPYNRYFMYSGYDMIFQFQYMLYDRYILYER